MGGAGRNICPSQSLFPLGRSHQLKNPQKCDHDPRTLQTRIRRARGGTTANYCNLCQRVLSCRRFITIRDFICVAVWTNRAGKLYRYALFWLTPGYVEEWPSDT